MPAFDPTFRQTLAKLLEWRRDVRHFRTQPVSDALIKHLLKQAMQAPSVGLSQPWRWVLVKEQSRRQAIQQNFEKANTEAAKNYQSEQSGKYKNLKLEGLKQAPVHIAVFADETTATGHGLGRQTMPGTLTWSVVMAIHTLWLAARAEGLGLGWISILHPAPLNQVLDVPPQWTPIAYLCLGWPEHESDTPLLEEAGWEHRTPYEDLVLNR